MRKMIKKIGIALLLVHSMFLATVGVAGDDPVLGNQSKISAWSYNEVFGRRFSLPEMTEEGLLKDVWAMEFRLVRDMHDSAPYQCLLNVYVNNKLKIWYPRGRRGFS